MNSPIEDIKREKRALLKDHLIEEIEKNNTLFNGNKDAIIVLDIEGNIVQLNPAFEQLSHYCAADCLQIKYPMLFPIEILDKVFHYFHKTILGQVHNFDCIMTTKNGKKVDLNVTNIPIGVNDQIVGVYAVLKDITLFKRKKLEVEDVEKFQEILLNAEKLNIAGQLAAGIAHEVRNPLTAIKGFLQLMEAGVDKKSYYRIIQSEMDRIELILSELLVLAKPQDIKFENENMKWLIDDVKTLIDTQAIMNNVLIEVMDECGDLEIRCDKNQIKQVFINFLKNAIEAMPDGGTITIEIKKLSTNKVKIFFKDTGTGIPHEILKRIGEPFFTTKENGTGLGIMISKQIIENHHGSVHFWSDEKGTIIEVILPIQIENNDIAK